MSSITLPIEAVREERKLALKVKLDFFPLQENKCKIPDQIFRAQNVKPHTVYSTGWQLSPVQSRLLRFIILQFGADRTAHVGGTAVNRFTPSHLSVSC